MQTIVRDKDRIVAKFQSKAVTITQPRRNPPTPKHALHDRGEHRGTHSRTNFRRAGGDALAKGGIAILERRPGTAHRQGEPAIGVVMSIHAPEVNIKSLIIG